MVTHFRIFQHLFIFSFPNIVTISYIYCKFTVSRSKISPNIFWYFSGGGGSSSSSNPGPGQQRSSSHPRQGLFTKYHLLVRIGQWFYWSRLNLPISEWKLFIKVIISIILAPITYFHCITFQPCSNIPSHAWWQTQLQRKSRKPRPTRKGLPLSWGQLQAHAQGSDGFR